MYYLLKLDTNATGIVGMQLVRYFLGPILPIVLWCSTVTVGAICTLSEWNVTFGNKFAVVVAANLITIASLQVLSHLPRTLIKFITNTTRINASIALIMGLIGLPAFCLMLIDGSKFTLSLALISFLVFETVNQINLIVRHVDWRRL